MSNFLSKPTLLCVCRSLLRFNIERTPSPRKGYLLGEEEEEEDSDDGADAFDSDAEEAESEEYDSDDFTDESTDNEAD